MTVALMQLSEPTRAALAAVNVAQHFPTFAQSDLAALLLFLALAGVLYLVAGERLLGRGEG